MSSFGANWRAVRHVRPRQLARRVQLTLRRKAMAALPIRERWGTGAGAPAVAHPLPRPVLPPRRGHHNWTIDGEELQYLDLAIPLRAPIPWDPAVLEAESLDYERIMLHAMGYLEVPDDAVFAAVVTDWIRQCRPYTGRYWLGAWHSFAVSVRCLVWMQQLAVRWDRLEASTRAAMAESLIGQLRFLERNLETDVGGNHLIANVTTLLWGARFFAGPEARRLERVGTRLLLRELEVQVLTDGVHFERSPSYHCQVFSDLLNCRVVLPAGPARDALDGSLEKMAAVVRQLTHPDGMVSLFNDGGLHMTYQPADCLAAFAALGFEDPRLDPVIDLPEAGYFGLRREADYLLVDCGPIGPDHLPAHGHGDVGSFEWDVAGRRVIVDAGVYEYRAGPLRRYARSTAAHNMVTVDDRDQSEFFGSFRVGRRARIADRRVSVTDGVMVLEGAHDGYRRLDGAPTHRRRVESDAGFVDVEDAVSGGAGQAVRARLLCHPDCSVARSGDDLMVSVGDIRIRVASASTMSVSEAWWMPDFGIRHRASQIIFDYGRAPCNGGFRLVRV